MSNKGEKRRREGTPTTPFEEQIEEMREGMEGGGSKLSSISDLSASMNDMKKLILMVHDNLACLQVKNLEAMDARVKSVENDVADHEDRLKKVEEKLVEVEARGVQNNLILVNLSLHDNAARGTETLEQTTNRFHELLCALKLDDQVKGFSAKRFPQTELQKKRGPPTTQVKLADSAHKRLIFEALAKAPRGLNVGVNNEFPASLRPQLKALSEKAAKIRADSNKTTKTKIALERNKLVLKVKNQGEATYKKI